MPYRVQCFQTDSSQPPMATYQSAYTSMGFILID